MTAPQRSVSHRCPFDRTGARRTVREAGPYGYILYFGHPFVGREYIPADSVPVSAAVRSDGLGQSTDLVGGVMTPPYRKTDLQKDPPYRVSVRREMYFMRCRGILKK